MKKYVLLSLLAVSTLAMADTGIYAKAGVGIGFATSLGVGVGMSAEKLAPSLKNMRIEANYATHGSGMRVHSAGVSMLYDFKPTPLNQTKITPYVGASFGAVTMPITTYEGNTQTDSRTQTYSVINGIVGLDYQINNKLSVDLSGSFGSMSGSGNLAVRYKF